MARQLKKCDKKIDSQSKPFENWAYKDGPLTLCFILYFWTFFIELRWPDFINIKCAHFLYESPFWQLFLVTCMLKKLLKWRSYEKCTHLTLMKLTPDVMRTKVTTIFIWTKHHRTLILTLCWSMFYMFPRAVYFHMDRNQHLLVYSTSFLITHQIKLEVNLSLHSFS